MSEKNSPHCDHYMLSLPMSGNGRQQLSYVHDMIREMLLTLCREVESFTAAEVQNSCIDK